MDISEAQRDMRVGYLSGAPGVLASSIAWAAAAGAAALISPQQAIWVLFIGGMLIHPAGLLIGKVLGASVTHTKGNPLAGLVGANTIWMIACLPLAYIASMHMIEWFFPAMLLIIGGRYLTFGTLYGMRLYWVLGFALIGAGFGLGVLAPCRRSARAAEQRLSLRSRSPLLLHRRFAAQA